MTIGVVGRKCGMTRVFNESGKSVPVTVIKIEENRVVELRDENNDGYKAVRLTTGLVNPSRLSKPVGGNYAKAGVQPGRGIWEMRLPSDGSQEIKVGDSFGIDEFEPGQYVDVVGKTLGKGFSGPIKRHNFRSQDATHGNSVSHRAPGSIGQCQTPGRVFKGKKMAGRMGNTFRTAQNLEVVAVDKEKEILMIKGAVPGHRGSDVVIKPAVKKIRAAK